MKKNSKENTMCVVLGDFNARPDSECVEICDGEMTDVTKHIQATFHGFGRLKSPIKIDYIYVTSNLKEKVKDAYIWDDCKNDIYLSDHYPVCMELDV